MTGTARYEQIEHWLARECDIRGIGARLPTEVEVAHEFGVSRMTARRAFENLVAQGRIARRRGSGSVVLSTPLHREGSVLRSFTEDMRRRGLSPSSRLLRAEVGVNPVRAGQLGLDAGAWVVTIERVRLADGVPIALEATALPEQFAEALDADLEHSSLHAALADLGRTLTRATGHVTARLARDDEASVLEVTPPAALLVETRILTDGTGQRVEATESAYVGSRWAVDTGAFVEPAAGQ